MKPKDMTDEQLIKEIESRTGFDISDFTKLYNEVFERFKKIIQNKKENINEISGK
jgi:hypothetical protein